MHFDIVQVSQTGTVQQLRARYEMSCVLTPSSLKIWFTAQGNILCTPLLLPLLVSPPSSFFKLNDLLLQSFPGFKFFKNDHVFFFWAFMRLCIQWDIRICQFLPSTVLSYMFCVCCFKLCSIFCSAASLQCKWHFQVCVLRFRRFRKVTKSDY